jgi:hypothetical protein
MWKWYFDVAVLEEDYIMKREMKNLINIALLFCLVFSGCTDLEVPNTNAPDRDRALSNASDVEALLSSQFKTYWAMAQGPGDNVGSVSLALAAIAEVVSSNSANDGTQDAGEMPPIATPNQMGYNWGLCWRAPWLKQNRALAAIRDGLLSIEEQGLVITEAQRAQAFAKFMQGLFLGQIALLYDKGFVIDETVADVQTLELQAYGDVMKAALGYLAEARSIASANSFTIPSGWMGSKSYSNEDLVRLTNSYAARFMAQIARTPAERAAVDWNAISTHVSNGIVEDFGVELDGPGGVWTSSLKSFSSENSSISLPFIGPADQSGEYTSWENTTASDRVPFEIDTDDRRITDGTATGPGIYVVYRDFFTNMATRGTYFLSNYSNQWWIDIGETGYGFATDITVQEMQFLQAEADIRSGNAANALSIINGDRVAIGELPAATVDGVSGDRCVPRAVGPLAKASGLSQGACGDLLTTLVYEKRMAMVQVSTGSVYYDARGFGTLRTGRPLHLAIPVEDLELLGLEWYTFGGGGAGSSP